MLQRRHVRIISILSRRIRPCTDLSTSLLDFILYPPMILSPERHILHTSQSDGIRSSIGLFFSSSLSRSLSFSPRARFIGCFLHGHPVVRTSPAFFSLKSPLVIRSHTQRKEMAPLGNSAVSIENTSHYKSNRLHGFYYLLSKIALHSNGLLSQTSVRV